MAELQLNWILPVAVVAVGLVLLSLSRSFSRRSPEAPGPLRGAEREQAVERLQTDDERP